MNKKRNIAQRRYMSTYDFVATNKLEKEANQFFGEGWEAEDDVVQIEGLLEYIGAEFYTVVFIEDIRDDYDIEVIFNDDLKRIDELEKALKELIQCKEQEDITNKGFYDNQIKKAKELLKK